MRLWVAVVAAALSMPVTVPGGLATPGVDASYLAGDWPWDQDKDKVDDGLEAMMAAGTAPDTVAVFVHYLAAPGEQDAAALEGLGAAGLYRFHALPSVRVIVAPEAARDIAAIPLVWGVELAPRFEPMLDVSVSTVKVRPSSVFPSAVWNTLGTMGEGMVIAILDTGVDEGHADLDDLDDDPSTPDLKFVAGADTSTSVPVDGNPMPDHFHGTHVAGTAVGTGSVNSPQCTPTNLADECFFRGVAPRARLVDLKIANGGADVIGGIAVGFDWVIRYNKGLTLFGAPGDDRIDVASLSFGCGCHGAGGDMTSRIVNEVVKSGVVVTIAAGNSGPGTDTLNFPGVADGAITVANSDDRNTITRLDDFIAGSSSRGPRPDDGDADRFDELKPEIAAPGTSIFAPLEYTRAGYVGISGTSMATPHIAGVAALMLQANPSLRPLDKDRNPVKDILIQTAETKCCGLGTQPGKFGKTWNNAWGYGLVDAFAAVQMALATPAPALQVFSNGPYRGYAGVPLELRASVGGGTAPYEIAWDLDAGGTFDDAGGERATLLRKKGTHPVRVQATDAAGALASDAGTATVEHAPFYDDFETDKGWLASSESSQPAGNASSWQRVDASKDFSWEAPTTGDFFWYAGAPTGQVLGAAYAPFSDARLTSPAVDLRRVAGPATLHYDASGSVGFGDFLRAEAKRAGDADWTLLRSVGGNVLGMRHYSADLSPFVGSEVQLRFRFVSDGSFIVCCFAGFYLDTVAVTAKNALPRAAMSVGLDAPSDMDAIPFSSAGSGDADGDLGFLWDFGDGTTSSEADPTHLYDDGGTYTVSLTVTDGDGATDRAEQVLTVADVSPTAAFDVLTADPTDLEPVLFRDRTVGKGVALAWDFGDGTTSAERDPAHLYDDGGGFVVRLTATDSAGDTSTAELPLDVRDVPPLADFLFSPLDPTDLDVVAFEDRSVGKELSYAWDLGDGAVSAEPSPSHLYADDGLYLARLAVTDDEGRVSEKTVPILVRNVPPTAAMSFSPQVAMVLEPVRFKDLSVDLDGLVKSRLWEFGDGFTSTEADPVHAYVAGGAYKVTLTVTDDDGATASVDGTVFVCAPGADVGALLTPERVRLEVQSCLKVGAPALPV